jgi:hypothetical protein
MVLSEKQPEDEKPKFKEIRGGLIERFQDRFKEHPDTVTVTSFGGRNEPVLKQVGKILLEFKNCGDKIVINDIGVGVEELWGTVDLLSNTAHKHRNITKKNISYEPFELLNQARAAGILPSDFVLNAIDVRNDALLAVKSTKVLMIHISDASDSYFKKFFPESHGEKKDNLIPVKIPKEYRKRIKCYLLDLNDQSAPQAHITFAVLGAERLSSEGLENLVKSTRKGGYIITDQLERKTPEELKKLNVVRVRPNFREPSIYQVIG